MIRITTPLTRDKRTKLKCGKEVLLSGTVYTARDAAHKKLSELIKKKKKLPFNVKDSVIYYAGPTPERPDGLFGSCGPTTSSRMDAFTPALLEKGLAAMIGKGRRGKGLRDAIRKSGAVYLIAVGGAGAYLATRIVSKRTVAFKELGAEAIYELKIKDFPVIVAIDRAGRDIFGKKG